MSTTMIRKNALLCKLIRIKTSSKFLFDSFMAKFKPELETCPICGSTGNCHIHAYYGRSIVDLKGGHPVKSDLCVLRVICDSCGHAHAILPDLIIPYSRYSLFFILRLLGEYFSGLYSVEHLCERFGLTTDQLYRWLALWKVHKQEWLGVLPDAEVSNTCFLQQLVSTGSYSSFAMAFVQRFRISFLQSHANPVAVGTKNAHYCQTVFAPDIFLF